MREREQAALLASGLFQNIPPQEVPELLRCLGASEVRLQKNEMLWRMGDPVRACVLILSGSLRAEGVSAAGAHTLVARHGPGSLVGDVLMATPGATSPVYVLAETASAVLLLPYRGILDGCPRCCPRHGQLRENLLAEMAGKFWEQRRRLRYLATRQLRGRIALYLLDRNPTQGQPFRLGLTREALADLLGVNRSALSRELGRMQSEGILEIHRDRVCVLDMAALHRY